MPLDHGLKPGYNAEMQPKTRRTTQNLLPNDSEVLTAEGVAAMLGISDDLARSLLSDGTIPAKKPAKRWLTTRTAVLDWLASK